MSGLKIHRATGAALVLATLAWCAPMAQALAAGESPELGIGRPASLALLGVALLGIGGVFRWAVSKPVPRPVTTVQPHEFRDGFRKDKDNAAISRPASHDNVVIELRKVLAERQAKQQLQAPDEAISAFTPEERTRLQEKLHNRAASLRDRNADQAKRRFLRSGIDVHGIAAE